MRNYLLFLSVLIAALAGMPLQARAATDSPADRFTFTIDIGKANLTGIMAVSNREDVVIGSLINEFGISAANFIYYKESGKFKLLDVISFLNKWYIKRVLAYDLKIALCHLYELPVNTGSKYELTPLPDGLKMINRKRHIVYQFERIMTCPEETESPDEKYTGK